MARIDSALFRGKKLSTRDRRKRQSTFDLDEPGILTARRMHQTIKDMVNAPQKQFMPIVHPSMVDTVKDIMGWADEETGTDTSFDPEAI